MDSIPAVFAVLGIVGLSMGYLSTAHLEPQHSNDGVAWTQFVGVILALSGGEAVANITGVMKLDPGSTPDKPKVTRTAAKAIIPVAVEVVLGTALLGWAMLSMPKIYQPELLAHSEDMLRYLGEHSGTLVVAPWFGIGGPAGLPPDVVKRINAALVTGMQSKEVLDRFTAIGASVHTSTPEEFVAYIRSEHARWGEVIRKAGVKTE